MRFGAVGLGMALYGSVWFGFLTMKGYHIMQTPDPVYAKMTEIESRMGLPSLESTLAKRQELVEESAMLRAKYGPWGVWDAVRKSRLSAIKMECRARAVEASRKVTEAYLDDEAHADDRYVALIEEATLGKARLTELEAKIEETDAIIRRGDMLGRYLTAEMHL